MNTDKIYAEQIANEYAPKQTSKVKALKRLDAKAKNPAKIFSQDLNPYMPIIDLKNQGTSPITEPIPL